MKADLVLGMGWGDEGKGKVTLHLLKKEKYDLCMRGNGGHNAGHTVYQDGNRLVTHAIPTGMIHGVQSLIGPGCVVNMDLLEREARELGPYYHDELLFIDGRAHIIGDNHILEDRAGGQVGTTGRGNGPAYRDKYARVGKRYGDNPGRWRSVDTYSLLYDDDDKNILYEGAQGWWLDIDWGDYPWVTSSHCGLAGAIASGIHIHGIRRVYGVAKGYDTYVGGRDWEDDGDEMMKKIRVAGHEFGATTGRPRQVRYLDISRLIKACKMNCVTHLVVNKLDVLRELNCWRVIWHDKLIDMKNEERFRETIRWEAIREVDSLSEVIFSDSPELV